MRRIPTLAVGLFGVAATALLLTRGGGFFAGDTPPADAGEKTAREGALGASGPEAGARRAAGAPPVAERVPAVAETSAICGLVVAELGGGPLAGALVALRGGRGARTAHADEEGNFCFEGLPAGRYDLVAQHDGRRSETVAGIPLEAGEALHEIALVVRGGARVSGRIVDRRTGEGIPEARIATACGSGFGFAEGRTDRDGAFRLEHVPPGRQRIAVTAEGYADGALVLHVADRRAVTGVSLVLDPVATIRGRVLDTEGRPVEGAAVRAVPHRLSERPDAVEVQGERAATTAEDGTFVLSAPPGLSSLVAEARGHGPGRTGGIEVSPGGRLEGVEVRLGETAGLVVDVLLPSGEPATGARLEARCDGTIVCGRATADDAGRAVLTDLGAGRVVLHASSPGGPGRARVPVTLSAGVRRHLTVALSPTAVLSGVVSDERGRPLAGATVAVREAAGGRVAETTTGAEGRFFADVPGDVPLEVVAEVDGALGRRAGVRAGDETRIIVRALGRVTGWVADPAGRPVTDATVTLVGEGGEEPGQAPEWRRGRFASERGDFAFDDLTPGAYRLQAHGAGHAPGEEVAVQVWSGSEAGPVRLVVSDAGRVRGRVVDPAGRPVRGARVALERGRLYGIARHAAEPGTSAETDATGGFLLDGVPAGDARRIYAWHPGFRAGAGGPVTVRAGREVGPVEVRLRPRPPSRRQGERVPTFGGVGMTLSMNDEAEVRIGEVYPGGPAFLSGLRSGDRILAVDGVPVESLGLRGVLRAIRGPVGTDVILLLERAGRHRFEVGMVRVELAL